MEFIFRQHKLAGSSSNPAMLRQQQEMVKNQLKLNYWLNHHKFDPAKYGDVSQDMKFYVEIRASKINPKYNEVLITSDVNGRKYEEPGFYLANNKHLTPREEVERALEYIPKHYLDGLPIPSRRVGPHRHRVKKITVRDFSRDPDSLKDKPVGGLSIFAACVDLTVELEYAPHLVHRTFSEYWQEDVVQYFLREIRGYKYYNEEANRRVFEFEQALSDFEFPDKESEELADKAVRSLKNLQTMFVEKGYQYGNPKPFVYSFPGDTDFSEHLGVKGGSIEPSYLIARIFLEKEGLEQLEKNSTKTGRGGYTWVDLNEVSSLLSVGFQE